MPSPAWPPRQTKSSGGQLAEIQPGVLDIERELLTVGQARDLYMAFLAKGNHANTTLDQYRSRLDGLVQLLGAETTIEAIDRAAAVALRDRLLALSPN